MNRYVFVDYASQTYLALVGLLVLCFHNQTVPAWGWLVAAHAACMVAVHGLVQRPPAGRFAKPLDFLRHFYPVLLYLFFFSETGWLNRMFFTEFMDPMAIGWEQALFGCQPSIVFMEKLPWLPLSEIFYASYFSYYAMIAGVGVALYLRDRAQFFHYLSVMSFLFYICYVIYIFIPIIGPRLFLETIGGYHLPPAVWNMVAVHDYPAVIKTGPFFKLMKLVYELFEAAGSAMPSSHIAVAWCTVYFSFRYLKAIRYPHAVVAFLLTLATIYCRYHYCVDVMAGLVTCAILLPLGNRLYFRFER
ncbi:MAG: phosphatase PAP2 family protein [Limisphaerales bacterium]